MDTFEQQVAAIEAAHAPAEPVPAAPEPVEATEPLELTDGEEAVEVSEGEEGGEEHEVDGKRRRSKPASQRIAELTAKLRETERQLAARNAPADEPAAPPEKPDASAFEFGEADPAYIDKMTDWKLENRDFERSKVDTEAKQRQQWADRVSTGVALAEENAKAKYTDFDERLAEAVEARGGEPLPAALSIGVSLSPVGGDLIYRLATDDAASERLESLAKAKNAHGFAMAMGELEGEYLEDMSDADLDTSDQVDMARMMGRMRARMKGSKAPAQTQAPAPTVSVTNAPEPPSQRIRGSAGRGKIAADTDDMQAFMREYGGQL